MKITKLMHELLLLMCLTVASASMLVACGGGGETSSGGGTTVAGGGAAGEDNSEGNGSDNDGPGEAAGVCKAINHKRFRFDLVREITPPSAPPTEKMIVIRGYGSFGSGEEDDFFPIEFTTNNGVNDDTNSACDIECGNAAFVAEYEQTFGVINMDCR